MSLRAVSKQIVERSGAIALWHRLRNREHLTVAMFHRVLPADEQEKLAASSHYTVTPAALAQMITYLKGHYNFVGVEDVLASRARTRPLPPRPLLITFDDGWRDNLDYAMPVLKAAGVPWLLFAAVDAMASSGIWWQEALQWARRTGNADYNELWRKAGDDPNPAQRSDIAMLLRYEALDEERRTEILAPYIAALKTLYGGDIMLDAAGLRTLQAQGVGIGAHGASHLPLTAAPDAEGETKRARDWLAGTVGEAATESISFPHGRYDPAAVATARAAGFRLLFTSDRILNACPGGWLKSDILGRVYISGDIATDSQGAFAPSRLASWLMLQERGQLAG
jgi:peptidoglycan/xylan/chitin deacetylase (PgdA/CDA1 family)